MLCMYYSVCACHPRSRRRLGALITRHCAAGHARSASSEHGPREKTIDHRSGGSSLTWSRREFRSSDLRDGARPSSTEPRLLVVRSMSMLDRGDLGAFSSESYTGMPQPISEISERKFRCVSPKADAWESRKGRFRRNDESACELRHAGRPEVECRARVRRNARESLGVLIRAAFAVRSSL